MDASLQSTDHTTELSQATTVVSRTNATQHGNRYVAAILYCMWLLQRRTRTMQRCRTMYMQSLRRRKAFLAKMRHRKKFFATIIFLQLLKLSKVKRTVWSVPRSASWWQSTVLETYTDEQWLENFRMTKETFHLLCSCLRPYMERASTRFRDPIPTEQRVGMALYRLASGLGLRAVGNLFGASAASVCHITRDFIKAVVDNLLPEFLCFPQDERLRKVVTGFEQKWGFPQCVGAIGGTHIPVMPRTAVKDKYTNGKGWCSVHAQCIVDHQLLFTDVFVGWPGQSHEAQAFKNSPVYLNAKQCTPIFPAQPRCINGVEIPLALVGDPSYPLKDWLMRPYPTSEDTSQEQKNFNYQVSKSRMVVEIALGRLKGRWRILLRTTECNADIVSDVFLTCCVLHNMCEFWGEDFLAHWIDEMSAEERKLHRPQPSRQEYQGREGESASTIRNTLATFLES